MKKRIRKKKTKHYYKKFDIEISDIKCLEKDFNYIVTFKVYENNRCYKSQILEYMPAFKYIHFMRNDCTEKTLLKGVVDLNKRDLSLFIPKYKIKARDAVLCLGQCVSSKARINSL